VRPGLSANLDLLRAIAVLLVLAQHLCKRMSVDQIGWIPTSSLGHFGVLLFFVHTSLVLMYSMDRSGLTGPSLLKNFYIRRIFRIYPLSILTVLVALLLHLDSDVKGVAGLSYGELPGKASIILHFLLAQNLIGAKSIVKCSGRCPLKYRCMCSFPSYSAGSVASGRHGL
jgi:peptidoglycan/LPS O-acetylase OafA/YrhL